jgi:transcriptional regulator with XRE-family HTH domain
MREIRSIAVKVRSLRAFNEMSINELSDKSGISPRTINRVEAADMVGYNPQIKTIVSLSHALGVTLGNLLNTRVKDISTIVRQ